MLKFLFGSFVTLGCLVLGLVPEFVMYGLWNLVQPTTELAKIAFIALFYFGGGVTCIFFAVGAMILWVAFMKALVEQRW